MRLPNTPNAGIGTTGATGLIILSGIIFSDLSAWWLILAVFFIIAGINQETKNKQ